jgi:hypothetical protein
MTHEKKKNQNIKTSMINVRTFETKRKNPGTKGVVF